MNLFRFAQKFHHEESDQDLLEYALISRAAVLAAVVTGSTSLANTIASAITALDGKISNSIGLVS